MCNSTGQGKINSLFLQTVITVYKRIDRHTSWGTNDPSITQSMATKHTLLNGR